MFGARSPDALDFGSLDFVRRFQGVFPLWIGKILPAAFGRALTITTSSGALLNYPIIFCWHSFR